jgi:hypothetical protein
VAKDELISTRFLALTTASPALLFLRRNHRSILLLVMLFQDALAAVLPTPSVTPVNTAGIMHKASMTPDTINKKMKEEYDSLKKIGVAKHKLLAGKKMTRVAAQKKADATEVGSDLIPDLNTLDVLTSISIMQINRKTDLERMMAELDAELAG